MFFLSVFFALAAGLPLLLLMITITSFYRDTVQKRVMDVFAVLYAAAVLALAIATTVLMLNERLERRQGTGYAIFGWLVYIGGTTMTLILLA
jgi:hypothetical protein